MKKTILYLIVILFTSCHTASYVHDLKSTPYGIDYRDGNWLLNEPIAPELIKEKVTKIAFDGFYENLGDRLKKAEDLTSLSLSYVPITPDSMLLIQLKKETQFDYLINIQCKSSQNEIGAIKVGQTYSRQRNVAEAILEVYDLNTLEIIYSRRVVGQVSIDDGDNEDFAFVKSANGIMIGSLKRIMRKLKSY